VDAVTEVRYVGVVVGRGATVRSEAGGAFVVFPEPLPVGTSVVLRGEDGDRPALVTEVIESADPNSAGMRIRYGAVGAKPAAPQAAPPPAAEPAPAPPVVQPAAEATTPEAAAPVATVGETDSGGSGDLSQATGATGTDQGPGDHGQGGSGKRRRRRR
jgi:hypothetical protein